MASEDRFKIQELTKFGSSAISRDTNTDRIIVRTLDGKELPNDVSTSDSPFNVPAKRPQLTDRTKEDLASSPTTKKYAGETSGRIEVPKYDIDELKKAIDTDVDELVVEPRPPKPEYVLKSRYDELEREFFDLNNNNLNLRETIGELESELLNAQGQISDLNVQVDSAELQLSATQNQAQALEERFQSLLVDFQTAIIKGTREGIERVSLTAQVQGLRAQKAVLLELLEASKARNDSLSATVDNLTQQLNFIISQNEQLSDDSNQQDLQNAIQSINGVPNGFGDDGQVGWSISGNKTTRGVDAIQQNNIQLYYIDKPRDNPPWKTFVTGDRVTLYNFSSEQNVIFTINTSVSSGDNAGYSTPWITTTTKTISVPPRVGQVPGKRDIIFSANFGSISHLQPNRGRVRNFDDVVRITNNINTNEIILNARYLWDRKK